MIFLCIYFLLLKTNIINPHCLQSGRVSPNDFLIPEGKKAALMTRTGAGQIGASSHGLLARTVRLQRPGLHRQDCSVTGHKLSDRVSITDQGAYIRWR